MVLKTMKSYVVKIAKEEFGHFVLLAVFDVVDDTKFVQKVILDVRPTALFIIHKKIRLVGFCLSASYFGVHCVSKNTTMTFCAITSMHINRF